MLLKLKKKVKTTSQFPSVPVILTMKAAPQGDLVGSGYWLIIN